MIKKRPEMNPYINAGTEMFAKLKASGEQGKVVCHKISRRMIHSKFNEATRMQMSAQDRYRAAFVYFGIAY